MHAQMHACMHEHYENMMHPNTTLAEA